MVSRSDVVQLHLIMRSNKVYEGLDGFGPVVDPG